MPNDFFQIYNHSYSFATSKVFSAGVTYSLPQNDYGIYGQQVDALFNSLSNSPGGTGNLVAWFVSDAGLTYYSDALGASAAVTGYISSKFPVTSSTSGLGLIDLRGSSDWYQIIGDGIIGPTKASSTSISSTNTQRYINGVTTLFNQLSTAYPNIDWAIAGLPYIPYEMTYAPIVGTAPAWDTSLTNSGNYTSPYWWDPQHPTGNTDQLYTWSSPPTALSTFYETVVSSGPQNSILSACDVGWICPDVRVPYTDALPFYEYGYDPYANYSRNKTLVTIASVIGDNKLVRTYPLISSMYPSRGLNQYDDHGGFYLNMSRAADEYGNLYTNIGGTSFYGTTASAAESFYPAITFRLDMIYASVEGNAHGFIYYDPAPSMVAIACTGTIASGATGSILQTRARNMFSNMMYGGAYSDGYEPSEGYTAQSTQSELLRYCAKQSMGYLNEIRESVNLSSYGGTENQFFAAKNGWVRSATDPNVMTYTLPVGTSTNRPESDDVYGEQSWSLLSGDQNACCPPNCDPKPTSTTCCCIEVSIRRFPNECCCPLVFITARSLPGAPAKCGECGCQSTSIDVNPGSLGDFHKCSVGPDCPPCQQNWSTSTSCPCITFNNGGNDNGDGTWSGGAGGLGCMCGVLGGDPVITRPCGGGGGGTESTTTASSAPDIPATEIYTSTNEILDGGGNSTFTSNPSLIFDFQNYKRAANSEHFILSRATNEPYTNWLETYIGIIDAFSVPVFYQASDTLLNPSASYRALQTHSNKDYARHYPNLYFKP